MSAHRATAVIVVLTCVLFASPGRAQPPAGKPVRLLVAAPAGSSIDFIGRLLAERLHDTLAQRLIVENLPGAGGTLAMSAVARADADGQTLGIGFNGPLAFAPSLYRRLSYDPQRDLQPIALTTSQPNVLVIAATLPVHSVAALLAYCRAHPGRLNYASVGNGSSSHLTMELLRTMAGFDVVHVPFNGSPPALNALASGDAQMLFAVTTAVAPLAQAGKVRMLAVTSAQRWPLAPQLPTLAEAGLAGFESLAWNGVVGPKGMPADRVAQLNRAIDRALQDPQVQAKLRGAGLEPMGGTPEVFAGLMRAEAKKWAPVIARTGAKLD